MNVLELFCGTKSFSKECKKLGFETFTVDINNKFKPTLCKNVLDLKIKDIPFIPDIIWASPPCTQYSKAKSRGVRDIKGANKIVLKTLQLIMKLNPKYWIIENPQTGLLKKQDFMKKLPFTDISYCMYGDDYRKQTRLWNNFGLKLNTCNKNCGKIVDGKHIGSAGNGRKKYTYKNFKKEEKYVIPKLLCKEILKQIGVKKK